MRNLIRRLRGEGDGAYGLTLDGAEIAAVALRRLSAGRIGLEAADKAVSNVWLCARKDLTFSIRHVRIPPEYRGTVYNYVKAFAPEKFPIKDESYQFRTDGLQEPDGTVFVHGLAERHWRGILKDFAEAGINPRQAAGLVPPSIALHQAVELLENRSFDKFCVILHLGYTGVEFVGIRGGRTVFHRSLHRQAVETSKSGNDQRNLFQQISWTERYVETKNHFGAPEQVILTGPWTNSLNVIDDTKVFFPKSNVRLLQPAKNIVSETLTEEDIRTHALAVGAAATGLKKDLASRLNFMSEPQAEDAKPVSETVYDKIILACGAVILALAFVTANAVFLDVTKSRMEKISENWRVIETLRAELRVLEPDLASAARFLDAAAVRFDSLRQKSFSIPLSVSKLLDSVASAAPDGIFLDKIESGAGAAATQGSYSNFFSNGEPATVILSGRADLPEKVIFFQDALRDALGVSVDIMSMGKEGDAWANKPVGFVIALRGTIRRA